MQIKWSLYSDAKRISKPWACTKAEEVIVWSEAITEELFSTFERKIGTTLTCSIGI
jgi:hypothetical protein